MVKDYQVGHQTAHLNVRNDELNARLGAVSERWLRLFEQIFWFDKWNACRVQAAAICGGQLK